VEDQSGLVATAVGGQEHGAVPDHMEPFSARMGRLVDSWLRILEHVAGHVSRHHPIIMVPIFTR
jgi:hypothetical protein